MLLIQHPSGWRYGDIYFILGLSDIFVKAIITIIFRSFYPFFPKNCNFVFIQPIVSLIWL